MVNLPLVLALSALVVQGASDFTLKRAVAGRGDPFSIMAMTVPTFALTSALSGWVLGALRLDRPTLAFGLATGLLSFLAMNLFVSSLKEGEASVNTMLFRLSFVVTSFLSIYFLNESAGWNKWLGLTFCAGAVYSVALGRGVARVGSRRSIALVLGALFLYGLNSFVFKLATLNGVRAPGMAVTTALLVGLLSAAAHFLPWGGVRFRPAPVAVRLGLVCGVLQAVSFNAIIWSLGLGGEASTMIPILHLSFVLSAALAVVRFREPLRPRKVLGFLLAALALVTLAG